MTANLQTTFLHCADVHLGFDRYDSPERSGDFFHAFRDLIQKHAIQAQVDFVLVAGDLFEYRTILPNVLNQAELVLSLLKAAQIPVLVIEGNHDSRPYGVKTSWLRYLAQHDYLILLEPTTTAAGVCLDPWDPDTKRGGYLDLTCGVRVIGSTWYGSTAPKAIEALASAIQALPPGPERTILMFHHGLEGQVARYTGALRYQDLLPLKAAGVDYLALGHIHKSYTLEDWVFNPGSVEANSFAESAFERGAFKVTLTPEIMQAKLVHHYYQRPCYRLIYEAKGKEPPEQLYELVLETVRQANIKTQPAPLVEFRIQGQVGFARHELNLKTLQQEIQALTGALVMSLKLEAITLELDTTSTAATEDQRTEIEEQVYADILASHAHYRKRSEELARVLLGLKEMVLDHRHESEIYLHLKQTYLGHATGDDE